MSDTVGKIGLELEVRSDLGTEINSVASVITAGLKKSFEGATNGIFEPLKESINGCMKQINSSIEGNLKSIQSNIKATLKSIETSLAGVRTVNIPIPTSTIKPTKETKSKTKASRGPPTSSKSIDTESIKSEIENLESTLETTNNMIDQQKEKLNQLREAYSSCFNQNRKNKIQEQILKTESAINKLISKSDKLGFKLADLDKKMAMSSSSKTSNEVKNLGFNVSNTSAMFKKLNSAINTNTNNSKKATNQSNKLSTALKSLGNTTKKSSVYNKGFASSLKMVARQFLTWMVVLPIIMKGLSAMASGLLANLNTNEQFATSLNQIKTNLMVAFTPIYNAILPAINTLMSALANISAYIASFTSAIFGTTYDASYKSTEALIAAKDAMGVYGDTTATTSKKVKDSLMGFDEINKLNQSDNSESASSAPTLTSPSLDTGVVDNQMNALANKLKDILSKAFEPLKNAWNKEGQATIKSIKYAFNNIKELLKSIGKSFSTVWLNGSGERVCKNILKILQDIFGILGDIAGSFSKAWDSGNTGTAIVQGLFDILNNVLECIVDIGENFRNAWNDNGEGDALLESILGLLENIVSVLADVTAGIGDSFGKATETLFPTMIEFAKSVSDSLSNIADGFRIIWDNGGQTLFDGIVQLIGQVAELIMKLSSGIFSDFSVVFKDIIAPAIGEVFDIVGDLLGKLAEFIEWINNNSALVETLATIIGSIALAIGLVNGAVAVYNGVMVAYNAITWLCTYGSTALGVALLSVNWPLVLITAAIAAVIAIGVLLYKHWDTVKEKCGQVWDWIKNKFQAFSDWLGSVFSTDWSSKFGIIGEVVNAYLANIKSCIEAVKRVFSGIIDFVAGVFTGDWSRAWEGVKNIFGGIFDGILAVAKAPINGILALINGLISAINIAIKGINKINIKVPNWVPGLGGKKFGFSIPQIPKINYLAKGGIVDQPTLSMVGEAGKEAVIPLENNTGGLDLLAEKLIDKLDKGNSSQRGDITLVVQLGKTEFGRFVIDSINNVTKLSGECELII